MALYGCDGRAAWQAISNMFLHLYGTLGALPEQVDGGSVPLGAPETDDTYTLGLALLIAEQAITIVQEDQPPPESFAQALRRFQSARQVMFLGFGFGKKNVERLQLDRIPDDVDVDCTIYDLTYGEILDSIAPAFPGRTLNMLRDTGPAAKPSKDSIRFFLRQNVQWFR